MARNQVEAGVRNGSEEQRFARFRFRDLDFVSIVVDLDDAADRALQGAIGPMLIAPETDFRVVRPTIWHTLAAEPLPGDPPGSRARNQAVLSGSIPRMLESAMTWAKRNFDTTIVSESDGIVHDQPAYPLTAFRELIANALASGQMTIAEL